MIIMRVLLDLFDCSAMILVGGIEMSLLRTKMWWWFDIWVLKWSTFLFGMIAGAYLSDFIKQHVWVFAVVAVILAIKPTIKFFEDSE